MTRHALDCLFRPRSVALIGASTDPSKIGGRPLHFLKKHGFTGDIWPVNPRVDEIEGLPCFPDIAHLPGTPDVAMILVGPAHAAPSIRALSELGTGAAVILAGGFAEIGDNGAERQAAVVAAAGGMRLLGPNTIGLMNMTDDVTLSASGALDAADRFKGGIAVISQSGGILGSLMSRAATRGVGLSHLVATGNEADIDVSDAIDFLIDDPSTRVISLYLETIRKPEAFRRAAERASASGKNLVVYKVGRSEAGARSAASHTGALAGEDRIFSAFFRQIGAIRAERYSDLIDIPMGLSHAVELAGKRVAILTHTGGAAGLVADVCGAMGFDAPPPGPETTQRLATLLQDDGFAPDRNPVDLTLAGLDTEVTYGAIATLLDSNDYDAVIPVVGSSSVGRPHLVADPVLRAAEQANKPMIVYTSPSAPEIVKRLNSSGVPTFDSPEACAAVLAALVPSAPISKDSTPTLELPPVPTEFRHARGALNEAEAKDLFVSFGIGTVRECVVATPGEAPARAAEIGPEVVVKILSRDLLHKTEVGGVRLNVPASETAEACTGILAAARSAEIAEIDGFLIQEQITDAVEMIVGFRRDPVLGPALLIGAGGTLAELYQDTEICLLPARRDEISEATERLKIAPLLRGYRGGAPPDRDALIDAAYAFARMCLALEDRLVEAEINPLFVRTENQGVAAADGVVVFRSE